MRRGRIKGFYSTVIASEPAEQILTNNHSQDNLRRELMKAIVYEKYGPPEVLQLREVAKPIPKENEVLVRIHATCVNSPDVSMSRGEPFLARLWSGLCKPKYHILGSDIAGRVEAVGKDTNRFQPDDEVFGDISGCGWGGFAEYVSVPESVLVPKPTNLTFEQAAAVPLSAVVALQGLRDKGQIESGHKVLINGASGGIGTFAVQIAKALGAEVTGVCSTRNLEMVRSIGADHVIDYIQEDFTQNGQRYDLIFTVVGHRSVFDFNRALSPKGIYVGSTNSAALLFQTMLLGPFITMNSNKRMTNLMAKTDIEDLVFLKELIEAGKVVPVVDRCFPLREVSDAVRCYEEGHSQGKVVITVAENSN
jgi:NADPH:quinone reductase-like Zn-dependent oxidoreductase